MHPREVGLLDQGSVAHHIFHVAGVAERIGDRAQPVGPLGVPVAWTVVEHVDMGVERDSHASS